MVGDNDVNWVIEIVTSTQQLGTHLDALSHLQIGQRGYNGRTVSELAGPSGVRRLGIETVPQIVTRGLLVDAAAVRGVERLQGGEVVTVEDLRTAWGTSTLSPATPSSSTPAGAASGPMSTPTRLASPARGWSWRSGSRIAARP